MYNFYLGVYENELTTDVFTCPCCVCTQTRINPDPMYDQYFTHRVMIARNAGRERAIILEDLDLEEMPLPPPIRNGGPIVYPAQYGDDNDENELAGVLLPIPEEEYQVPKRPPKHERENKLEKPKIHFGNGSTIAVNPNLNPHAG